MARLAVLSLTILLAVTLAGHARAATYYVSASGDDTHAGTSPASAWQTLAKVDNTKLRPGDSVLLEGGQTFAGPLVPWGSGAPGSPVVVSSYGKGRATISSRANNIVYLHAVHWVTIENLRLTAEGADMHVIVGDPQAASSHVVIRNNLIAHTAAFGINAPSLAEHDWTIQGNTISNTGETGITFRGSGFRVIGNVIRRTGLDPGEAAHGVYAKGPAAQVIGNVIDGFESSGVSIRYANSVVRGNVISNGPIGVSYFQDAAVKDGGVSTIAYNRIWGVGLAGIFLDDSTLESFVIANNTINTTGGNGLNLHRVKSLTLVNNIVTGTFAGYAALLRRPSGTYAEHHNLWFPGGSAILLWNGTGRTLADYRDASGQGANDLGVDPRLGPALRPLRSSPARDAGAVVPGLGYRKSCTGRAFSYCGRAPDLGAIERRS